MVKSYIKIYGPPLCTALSALRKVAAESTDVVARFYGALTPSPSAIAYQQMVGGRASDYGEELQDYLQSIDVGLSDGEKVKLISTSGSTLGDHDFFFEWTRKPTWKQLETLITKIDTALTPLGCQYTMTTK